MTGATPVPVGWRPTDTPLRPTAVAAFGPAAARLLRCAAARGAAALRGVAGVDLVVLIGEAEALPWADGVVYLGAHPHAPGVLVPTAWEPTVPLDLLAAALRRRVAEAELPVAVLPAEATGAPPRLVPLGPARPLDVGAVEQWLAGRPR